MDAKFAIIVSRVMLLPAVLCGSTAVMRRLRELSGSGRTTAVSLLLAALSACAPEVPPEPPSPGTAEPETAAEAFNLPPLDAADYRRIASRIAWNETGGLDRHLTHWGEGEEFPSLGIGHFIWFPAGVDAPFDESFPTLVAYLEQDAGEAAPMPEWLERQFRKQGTEFDAPWPDKPSFDQALDSDEMRQLRGWLSATAPQQARFIARNFVRRWNGLELPVDEKETLTQVLQELLETPEGLFAVIDYVNFKGLGTNPRERYDGQGWGLLQVLGDIAATDQPSDNAPEVPGNLAVRDPPSENTPEVVQRFSDAAANRLKDRVALSPPERNEARWLAGWIERVSQYSSE